MKIKKEFKDLISPLTDEEFRRLEENILKDGLRHPIVIWKGYIIDGHNRYKICTDHNIPYKTEERVFESESEVIAWIIKDQLGRRNLSPAQKSKLALKLKPIIERKAKEKEFARKSTCQNSDKSLEKSIDVKKELAKIAGVSHDTIAKTEKILKKGTPEQISRVMKSGKGDSVNAVHKEVREAETKVCTKCGKEKPISDYYRNSKKCLDCYSGKKIRFRTTDGVMHEVDTEKEKAMILHTDPGRVITKSIDREVESFKATVDYLFSSLESALENKMEIFTETKENNKKMMAVLSEAEKAIAKMKAKYSI